MAESPDETLYADGFEAALLGVLTPADGGVPRAVYSVPKCIEVLMTRDEMTEDDAYEYFEFNVRGAYVGRGTPLYADGPFTDLAA